MTAERTIKGDDGDEMDIRISSIGPTFMIKVDATESWFTPAQAREAGYALIAMADAAEASQNITKAINEYDPSTVSHPGETLQGILDERGMSQAELAERMKRPKKTVNEIIKAKTAITPSTAAELEAVLGVPASFWLMRQMHYDAKGKVRP